MNSEWKIPSDFVRSHNYFQHTRVYNLCLPKKQKTSVEIAYIGFAISGDMNVIENQGFQLLEENKTKTT